ncbi:hypothetical protein, partial [Treponema pedis]
EKGIAANIIDKILANTQEDDNAIEDQRSYVAELKKELAKSNDELVKELNSLTDHFIKRSIWILGGDGWAYDIG